MFFLIFPPFHFVCCALTRTSDKQQRKSTAINDEIMYEPGIVKAQKTNNFWQNTNIVLKQINLFNFFLSYSIENRLFDIWQRRENDAEKRRDGVAAAAQGQGLRKRRQIEIKKKMIFIHEKLLRDSAIPLRDIYWISATFPIDIARCLLRVSIKNVWNVLTVVWQHWNPIIFAFFGWNELRRDRTFELGQTTKRNFSLLSFAICSILMGKSWK